MLSREEAERYGQISGAEVGLARLSGGRKFADEFFDPKTSPFEPEELTDLLGTRRTLARKIKDAPPRVPSLDEVRNSGRAGLEDEQGASPGAEGRRAACRTDQEKGRLDQGEDGRRIPCAVHPADPAPAGFHAPRPIRHGTAR